MNSLLLSVFSVYYSGIPYSYADNFLLKHIMNIPVVIIAIAIKVPSVNPSIVIHPKLIINY